MSVPRSAWFTSGKPAGPRIYVIPQAGAGAASVTQLRRVLDGRLPVVAVRLPFRESRLAESLPDSLHHLADALAAEISDHSGTDDFLLLGHCSGALLAYETAVRLAGRQGLAGLVVSAQVAPERFRPTPTRGLSPDEFRAYVTGNSLVPPEVLAAPALWTLVEPTLRADLRLCETYRPSGHVLGTPILAVHGRHDTRFRPSDAAAWKSRTRGGFRRVVLDRDHDYLSADPGELADALIDATPHFGSSFCPAPEPQSRR
ncbi:thioesterase domain-containing protein [Streptomyces sp. NBC_00433]